jgi:hypothetical protein
MTTKEAILEKIEQLDEDRARQVLDFLDRLLDDHDEIKDFPKRTEAQRQAMLSLIGMVRSEFPTNIAEYKDDYIADSILHPERPIS